MITIYNPMYSAVYKRLIDDNEVSKTLIDTLFHSKLCVKKIDGCDDHYISKSNSFVYYSKFDAVFLEGPNKLDKIVLELYRVVKPDFKISFMMEFIGEKGHYRGLVEGKEKNNSQTHLDKVISIFGGGFSKSWELKVEIDEQYDDSPEYKTIINALQRISCDEKLREEMLPEHIDDLLVARQKQLAEMIQFSASLGATPEQIAAQLNIPITDVETIIKGLTK